MSSNSSASNSTPYDERERLQQAAAPIADTADHQRRLAEFFERLLRYLNQTRTAKCDARAARFLSQRYHHEPARMPIARDAIPTPTK